MLDIGEISSEASFSDIITFIFHGMKIFIPGKGIKFEIPITWLSVQLFIAYLIGDYINQDMTVYGLQYIIRSKHKYYWFIGKITYCIMNVFLFYTIGYIVVMLFSLFFGTMSFEFHFDVCAGVAETNILGLNHTDLLLGITVLPILTSIVLSIGQSVLSLFVKPIYSIIGIVIYVSASAYYFSYALIGNYAMIVRSQKVVANHPFFAMNYTGIDPKYAIIMECGIICVLYIVGILALRKYDYIEKS